MAMESHPVSQLHQDEINSQLFSKQSLSQTAGIDVVTYVQSAVFKILGIPFHFDMGYLS